jgi:dTDP-glucose pyrophosphorylase
MDLFPGESDVIFICNKDHLAVPEYRMQEILLGIRPSGRIRGIEPHQKGPVHAVAHVFHEIRNDEPVIVNYCDFTNYWDYPHFRRFVQEIACDGAIPAYRGFHPHSLGSTFYAYMRERDGWAFDIQEKKPFTDAPTQEYASSGTYYFASGALMKHAFNEAMRQDINVNNEYYVSLAYKPMFGEGRRVAVYDLQHFMQWGTPEDVNEYRQHDRAFRALAVPARHRPARHAGTLLVPMAGAGARFAAAGYCEPKPLISVSGRPMAVAAAADLPQAERQVFVLRRDLPCVTETEHALRKAYPRCHVVMLDKLTEGQAITCLKALETVDPFAPLTIGACDTGLLYDHDRFEALLAESATDVIVWGFRGHDAARRRPTSYGWIDAAGDIVQGVAVKTALSDPATDPVVVGAFTFKRAADFKSSAERMIARNARVNGEYYIDTCINDAVALGLRVRLFEIDAYLCWGTPDELKTFEYWQSCFHKWDSHPYRLALDARVPLDGVDAIERRYANVRPLMPQSE